MFLCTRRLATSAKPILQDIVVVGGGPAGLSIVAALKNSPRTKHLTCTLVEASSLAPARSFAEQAPPELTNRVVSLTPHSVDFMRTRTCAWPLVHEDRVRFYDNMVAYDSQDSDARIHFDASNVFDASGAPGEIAAMAEVANIQASLLAQVEKTDATVLDNSKVVAIENEAEKVQAADEAAKTEETAKAEAASAEAADWPVVTLSGGQQLRARLLVGADGQRSPVRQYAGIEARGWAYDRFGVVGTLRLQYEDFRSIAWQRFLTTGPLAILPMPGDSATFVWSSTPELADVLLKTDDSLFPQLINAAMVLDETDLQYIYGMLQANPADPNVAEEIEWRMSKFSPDELDDKFPVPVAEVLAGSRARFPLRFSQADTYAAPRVALVGDAAHTVHPLAGQGLNMGQTDVEALVAAIEQGVARGMDIGSMLVLEQYVARAWPSNHMLMGVCDKLHKLFSTDFGPIVALRGIGLKSLNSLDGVKDLMIRAISGRA
ncbi:putative ubiquinone biosynthesis monooxygenase [Clavispora lusitaniae]|uniref:Ubiquinone biosynthesis monooxygenase COQ6, mitochondrial n=1 Tax=Clavispora lusitaniae TaxID=36911 RepID=A0AA91Q4Q0_CLALS|nr:putative ubiquinone biosynthesis monooxygenase [Clavispora lusitaniae]